MFNTMHDLSHLAIATASQMEMGMILLFTTIYEYMEGRVAVG